MSLESINPTTGETLATYPEMTARQVERDHRRLSCCPLGVARDLVGCPFRAL